MSWLEKYEYYLNHVNLSSKYKEELLNMSDLEKEDCFYKDIEFGTGGLRGVLGIGTNRLNEYIIRRVNYGFGEYLLKQDLNASCVIAHDNRHMSSEFALESAKILASKGIKVYLFDSLRPTPELSFAVRHLKATGGIVVTASHNPPEYNGYKVYNSDGCQLVPREIEDVISLVNEAPDGLDIEPVTSLDGIEYISNDVDNAYLEMVKNVSIHDELKKDDFKVVFTPEHGASYQGAKTLLESTGYNLILVEEQCTPDPNFSNTKSANPEDDIAYELALEYAKKHDADIIIATDPDGDRVGTIVKHNNDYVSINGNQLGAILLRYVINEGKKKGKLPNTPFVATSTVTSELGSIICKANNIPVEIVHTGFKFIGEAIKNHEVNNDGYKFIFGYEESYGYLVSDEVRDKDALQATYLLAEAANYYKKVENKSLIDVIEDIYSEYGYYHDKLLNFILKGKEGQEKISKTMDLLRENPLKEFGGIEVFETMDFLKGINGLPMANVLKYRLIDGSFIAFRPSGTEPKFKVYLSITGNDKVDAINKYDDIVKFVNELIK